ncbi:MAG TPA: hypothetical protein VFT84_13220, partial [Gemmatimonadales bacterium]|nr:hypothetical protein [Gemmatimonadales bacterium]
MAVALVASALPLAASAQATEADTSFLLTASDPARTPSPFLGNGRLSVIIPPLGLGPSRSFLAGLFEEAEGDVPRIVGLPAWNAIAVWDGASWLGLDSLPPESTTVREYRQTLDMRSGTATTSYEWVDRDRRTALEVETFISRAEPALASVRVAVTPRQPGPMRVRFGMAAWPEPRRLPLGRLERAPPDWKPADIWYPGHAQVHDRRAEREPDGGVVWLVSRPAGRSTEVAQVAALRWPGNLARPMSVAQAAGDTARLELAFEAETGRRY